MSTVGGNWKIWIIYTKNLRNQIENWILKSLSSQGALRGSWWPKNLDPRTWSLTQISTGVSKSTKGYPTTRSSNSRDSTRQNLYWFSSWVKSGNCSREQRSSISKKSHTCLTKKSAGSTSDQTSFSCWRSSWRLIIWYSICWIGTWVWRLKK